MTLVQVMVKNDKSTSQKSVKLIEVTVNLFQILVMVEIETLSEEQQTNEYMYLVFDLNLGLRL